MTEEQIRKELRRLYASVFGREAPTDDVNLMSPSLGNQIAMYLYWLEKIEKELDLPVYRILERADYTDMTIRRLSILLAQRGE